MITDIITKLKEKIEFCEKHEPQYGVTQDYAEGRLGGIQGSPRMDRRRPDACD